MPKSRKHLPAEDREQKKKEYSYFEVVGARRPNLGEVIKTAGKQDGTANHSGDFEIGQAFIIKHPVKFEKPDHSEQADQQPKKNLVSGKHDQQRDRPERDGADESQNKA